MSTNETRKEQTIEEQCQADWDKKIKGLKGTLQYEAEWYANLNYSGTKMSDYVMRVAAISYRRGVITERNRTRELPSEEKPKICDACKVREPFEHRCLGDGCECSFCEGTKIYKWLLVEKYPEVMTMTRDNLAALIQRYNG